MHWCMYPVQIILQFYHSMVDSCAFYHMIAIFGNSEQKMSQSSIRAFLNTTSSVIISQVIPNYLAWQPFCLRGTPSSPVFGRDCGWPSLMSSLPLSPASKDCVGVSGMSVVVEEKKSVAQTACRCARILYILRFLRQNWYWFLFVCCPKCH